MHLLKVYCQPLLVLSAVHIVPLENCDTWYIYQGNLYAGHQCQAVSQQLWLLLLQLQGSRGSAALSASARHASELLAEACGMQSTSDLAALHAPSLMAHLTQVRHCLLDNMSALQALNAGMIAVCTV